jgi:hypothetical protein
MGKDVNGGETKMKKWTQEEFDAVPRDETGWLNYPRGDYTQVTTFGEWSSFGEGSRFGEGARFGEWSSFGARSIFGEGSSFGARSSFGAWSSFGVHSIFGEWSSFGAECEFENEGKAKDGYPLLSFGGLGSENRTTYAFNLESGILIRCGCFKGTLEEFEKQVIDTHGDNIHAKEYLMIVELIRMKWDGGKSDGE